MDHFRDVRKMVSSNMEQTTNEQPSYVKCQTCGWQETEGSEGAEFIGWHGQCTGCVLNDRHSDSCDELNPCPFCGGEAGISVNCINTDGSELCTVNCKSCNAKITAIRSVAVTKWNTRALPPRNTDESLFDRAVSLISEMPIGVIGRDLGCHDKDLDVILFAIKNGYGLEE